MSDKPKPPPIVPRVNAQGLIEYVDIYTGKVVAIQSTPNDNFLNSRFENLVKITTPQGEVWIEKHMDPTRLIGPKKSPEYSLAWASLVAQKLLTPRERINKSDPLNGKPYTLKEALSSFEIDQQVFSLWRKNHQEFGEIIDAALQEQAQYLQDEALMTARSTTHPSQVAVSSLQIDTLMKQAKQANQQRFGEKQKIEHSGEIAHTIVVETGIRRGQPIPAGFEDAIRDATPKQDERKFIERDADGHAITDSLEGVTGPSPGLPEIEAEPEAGSQEEAWSAKISESNDGQKRELHEAAPKEYNQAKSLLELATACEDSKPVTIPDLTDKPF